MYFVIAAWTNYICSERQLYINYIYSYMTSEASVRSQKWGPSDLGVCFLKIRIPWAVLTNTEKILRITRKEQNEMFSFPGRKLWYVLLCRIGSKDQGMESQTKRIGCFRLDRNKLRGESNMIRTCETVGMIKMRGFCSLLHYSRLPHQWELWWFKTTQWFKEEFFP